MNKQILTRITAACVMTASFMLTTTAIADDDDQDDKAYEVTIINLTKNLNFTPIMVVSHKRGKPVFELGKAASAELAAIAEGGDTAPLAEKLMMTGLSYDTVSSGGLLGPGQSTTVQVKFTEKFRHISVASMLLPTNDAFFSINGVAGPKKKGRSKMMLSPAYDAGSEVNDELCANIPGPTCGGEPFSVADGEGFVHIHSGIHGVGDLQASQYDWRNPAAKIIIKRIKYK